MRFALFCHSVRSDWNNGNAHFLRGLVRELQRAGHQCVVYEPVHGWSVENLVAERGEIALDEFERRFDFIHYETYDLEAERPHDLARRALRVADICLAHEWTDPALLDAIADEAMRRGIPALYHDTHYRAVVEPAYVRSLRLERFAAVLAFGPSLAELYRSYYGLPRVEVFHEGADVALFQPVAAGSPRDDVVFIGNWGEDDRANELNAYLLDAARALPHLRFAVYGVRYPTEVLAQMRNGCRIDYRGWLANAEAPAAYAQAKVALHVPRRQYAGWLHGIPTIRVFEALACGVCLVTTPWGDTDHLFRSDRDYVTVWTPEHMRESLSRLCQDDATRRAYAESGRKTVLARHTCAHRAQQLVEIAQRAMRWPAAA
jgi:spore maturation protein CgeB